eukprot:5639635-Prymnesium_polylepis.1
MTSISTAGWQPSAAQMWRWGWRVAHRCLQLSPGLPGRQQKSPAGRQRVARSPIGRQRVARSPVGRQVASSKSQWCENTQHKSQNEYLLASQPPHL